MWYADTNDDGVVDATDYITLKQNYGASTGECVRRELSCAQPPAQMLETSSIEDSDNDGIIDEQDLCPDTVSVDIDDNGCSNEQFCESFRIVTKKDRNTCRSLDWKDDEKNPKDCKVKKEECIAR